jgi:CRISPR type III-A-associated protein Csm2
MADTQETEQQPRASESKPAESEAAPTAVQAPPAERSERRPAPQGDRPQGQAPQGQRREGGRGSQVSERRDNRGPHGGREGGREGGRDRGDDRRGDRPRFDGPPEIDIEKLISDPLYLDNQAHGVVGRMRDMDSGTKSQLRRLYNAVRRAVRTPESERQQQFVMLRARLAYTIARHSLRSLDPLEKLLLQVTRKNEARGYERFRDLFEAIVAYNE